jgi:hypothetical protein
MISAECLPLLIFGAPRCDRCRFAEILVSPGARLLDYALASKIGKLMRPIQDLLSLS